MNRIAPILIFAVVFAVAPITAPDIPARVIDYVKPEPHEVTLVAVGDMMLSRTVAKRMRQYGADYPFASTRAFIRDADISFFNFKKLNKHYN